MAAAALTFEQSAGLYATLMKSLFRDMPLPDFTVETHEYVRKILTLAMVTQTKFGKLEIGKIDPDEIDPEDIGLYDLCHAIDDMFSFVLKKQLGPTMYKILENKYMDEWIKHGRCMEPIDKAIGTTLVKITTTIDSCAL